MPLNINLLWDRKRADAKLTWDSFARARLAFFGFGFSWWLSHTVPFVSGARQSHAMTPYAVLCSPHQQPAPITHNTVTTPWTVFPGRYHLFLGPIHSGPGSSPPPPLHPFCPPSITQPLWQPSLCCLYLRVCFCFFCLFIRFVF